MKDCLKKIAKSYSSYDMKIILGELYNKIKEASSDIISNMKDITKEEAMKEVESIDILAAIDNVLKKENILSELDNKGLKVVASQKFENNLSNRIWSINNITDEIVKLATKKKSPEIEYDMCKHKVVAGEDGDFGIPGWEYCSLWKIPTPLLVQIDGRCVPKSLIGSHTDMVSKRQSLWESEDEDWGFGQLDNLDSHKYTKASLKTSKLIQKKNKKNGNKEWALVSKNDTDKVLKWFGEKKPTKKELQKEEKRINYFEHENK